MSGQMRGIYTIPPVVYHDDLTVDCEGTRRAVRFCLDCGSHGIVVPVYASEYFVLSAPERKAVLEAAVAEVDGAVPVEYACAYTQDDQPLEYSEKLAKPIQIFSLEEAFCLLGG